MELRREDRIRRSAGHTDDEPGGTTTVERGTVVDAFDVEAPPAVLPAVVLVCWDDYPRVVMPCPVHDLELDRSNAPTRLIR